MDRVLIPVYLPRWLDGGLRRVKRVIFAGRQLPSIDLAGDRYVEWSFVTGAMPKGPGKALDLGCGDGYMTLCAAIKGFQVTAVDLEPESFLWRHPGVRFMRGDFLKLTLPDGEFDLIINCSAVEHVGLSGRYGVAVEESDGDLAAMSRLRKLLKPSGRMLMTIPCGRDATVAPWHRVYGKERLPKLLDGYEVAEEGYWVKHQDNRWYAASKREALSYRPTSHATIGAKCSYALGCFVLRGAEGLSEFQG